MTDREPVDFTKSKDEVLAQLAEGNKRAHQILDYVLRHTPDALNTLIDVADMNLRGQQIVDAFAYCKHSAGIFTEAVLKREQEMVDYVNEHNPMLPPARQHGEQTRISQVDFAMKSALQAQQMDGAVERMDEGADYVHNFFLTVARKMQASKKFTMNMRVNTGLEQANTLVFIIALADVLDINGNSAHNSPTKEDERIQAVQAEIAAEHRQPLPPEIQKAMDEGRW